jgi:hypothetical protein
VILNEEELPEDPAKSEAGAAGSWLKSHRRKTAGTGLDGSTRSWFHEIPHDWIYIYGYIILIYIYGY